MSVRPSYLLLKLGVAFALIYPAISAFIHPYSWVGFFPRPILDIVGIESTLLLNTFGALEVGIALWILFGKHIFIPASIAAAMLAGIVALNLPQIDVLFRDIAIMLTALFLAYESSRAAS